MGLENQFLSSFWVAAYDRFYCNKTHSLTPTGEENPLELLLVNGKRLLTMRGSRNFRQGGPGQSDKKALTTFFFFFLVLSLFDRSQMVNFKVIYHFSRFQRGSNIFQGGGGGPTFSRGGGGGVQLLIPYRNPYNLWFSRGGPDPLSPSGSALAHRGQTNRISVWPQHNVVVHGFSRDDKKVFMKSRQKDRAMVYVNASYQIIYKHILHYCCLLFILKTAFCVLIIWHFITDF